MINELYIFNRDERKYIKHLSYVQLGIINNIKSLIWHEKFFDKGDFELVVPFSKENLELLQTGNIVTKNPITSQFKQTFMEITQVNITSSSDEGDLITVKGVSGNELLERRIIWNTMKFIDKNIVDIIYNIVLQNMGYYIDTWYTDSEGNPVEYPFKEDFEQDYFVNSYVNTTRTLRIYIFKKDKPKLDEKLTVQFTGKNILEVIKQLCSERKIGFEVGMFRGYTVNLGNYNYFKLIVPVDRSDYIIFSDDYDNIYNSSYVKNVENDKNVALLASRGEGEDRERFVYSKDVANYTNITKTGFESYNNNNAGDAEYFARKEVYVDLRDVAETDSDTSYAESLRASANEQFKNIEEAFDTELFTDGVFKFGQDFFLGDFVTIEKYGMKWKAQVIENIESIDENGYRNTPIFAY